MPLNYPNFIEAVLKGRVSDLDEIDDWVDAWHNGEGQNLELYQYLGMTHEEYCIWAPHPSKLVEIIKARKSNE